MAACGLRFARLKDQELILRFFAFRPRGDDYAAPIKEFLNQYTGWNRQLDHENEEELTAIFESTTELSHSDLARMRFRPARSVNAAVVDSLMTAVAEGIENDSSLILAGFGQRTSACWKTTNTGAEAAKVGQLRGEIREDSGSHRHNESTKYRGSHQCDGARLRGAPRR